jgi:ribonuclease P protein component
MSTRNTEQSEPRDTQEHSDESFPKHLRVRKARELDLIFKEGARYSCKGMRIQVLWKGEQETRAAFIAVRSFSGAVARNRAKRLARESWRVIRHSVKPGFDVAFVLFPGFVSLSDCRDAMQYLLRKADLLK